MGKIIVIANQKGGVSKTSTLCNLSDSLAELGKRVLAADFYPQFNLTTSFGIIPAKTPHTTGALMTRLLMGEKLPEPEEYIPHKTSSC